MTTKPPLTPSELYWDQQRKTLSRIRDRNSAPNSPSRGKPANGYAPLDKDHPLLRGGSQGSPWQSPRNSPRASPARLERLVTPPEHRQYQQDASLRGRNYERVPPLAPTTSYDREKFGSPAGYDSWGEEVDRSDDDDYGPEYPPAGTAYTAQPFPYPTVMMYPMVMGGQPQPRHRRRRQQHDKRKKRVHLRNTPTYLNSRENTLHEPPESYRRYLATELVNGSGSNSQFSHINPSVANPDYDPFDPGQNPVVAKYLPLLSNFQQSSFQQSPRQQYTSHLPYQATPSSSRYDPREASNRMLDDYVFAQTLVEDMVGDIIRDEIAPDMATAVIGDEMEKKYRAPSPKPRLEYNEDTGRRSEFEKDYTLLPDPLAEFMSGLLEDVVTEESIAAVKGAVHELVDEHLGRAAAYDEMWDMVGDVVKQEARAVAEEALTEQLYDDLLNELVIDPAIEDTVREVAVETLDKYTNKQRKQEIKEIKRFCGERMLDTVCLDYLLDFLARQGAIFTEGEHINKLFDSLILNVLLHQYVDVREKRKGTVDNKALRRLHEKGATDVAVDVVLDELSRCLDEDMADLDEYEHGYMDAAIGGKADLGPGEPSDLQRWLAGI